MSEQDNIHTVEEKDDEKMEKDGVKEDEKVEKVDDDSDVGEGDDDFDNIDTGLSLIPGGEEYTPAIAALPPKVVKQEENQVEVSASPAFQCLDEVSFQILYQITVHRTKCILCQ